MERHGYIRDIIDVKVLILYVLAQLKTPVDGQKIYELCYQDDLLSYFDVQQALPEMVRSGHLSMESEESYVITEMGREAEELTHDSLPFTVRERARLAAERYEYHLQRNRLMRTEIKKQENGEYTVVMGLDDPQGSIMKMELMAPTLRKERRLETAYRKNAEAVYQAVMIGLLEEAEEPDTEN